MSEKIFTFQKKRKTSVGIELGGHSVKMIEIMPAGENFKLLSYGISEIPKDEKGRPETDSNIIASAVKNLLSRCVSPNPKIYFSASGPSVSLQRISLPQMPEKEILPAILWKGKKHFPFSLNKSHVVWKKIEETSSEGNNIELFVAAVLKQFLNNQLSVFEKAGIRPSGIDIDPFAIQYALQHSKIDYMDKTVAFLDMRPQLTMISIFKKGRLHSSREIAIGGDNFTEALMEPFTFEGKQFALNFKEAETIKRLYGVPIGVGREKTPQDIPLSRIMFMLRPVLEKLITESLRSFDFYKAQTRDMKIERVLLCGGSAGLKNIAEFLSSGFGIETSAFDPFENFIISPDIETDKQFLENRHRLAIAAGLSIGQCRDMNLFPKRPGILETVQLRQWIPLFVLLLFLLALTTFSLYLHQSVETTRQEIQHKKAILASMRHPLEKINLLKQKRESLKKQLSMFPEFSFEQPQFSAIFLSLTRVFPENVSLTHIIFERGKNLFKKVAQQHGISALRIEGTIMGKDFEVVHTIAKIIESLNKEPFFHKVRLTSSKKIFDLGYPASHFVLYCPLDPKSFKPYGFKDEI